MRILIFQDILRSGGTERQSVLLANELAEAGHSVTLLTIRPGGKLRDTVARNVNLRTLQPFDTGLDWFAPGLAVSIEEEAPSVVLCMGRMANCYAGRIQRRNPDAVVVSTMRTGKPLPLLFRQSLQVTRHVVANSLEAAQILKDQYAAPPEKITVIHNALVFPPENFKRTAKRSDEALALRRKFGAGAATAVLLNVAMFRPEKNHRELVEIATRLPRGADWQLWLAGDGPTHTACAHLIAERNLEAKVKLTGFFPDPRLLYRAADIAVMASSSESLSNFLIEAHAHGLPSVAYAVTGGAECGAALVEPGDRHQFIDTLSPLLFNETRRAAAAAEAVEHVARFFPKGGSTGIYLNLFKQLTEKNE